jgi:Uridine kinase
VRKNKPTVVSIAAVAGGGKTTISREIGTRLENSKVLYFDDYELDVGSGIEDICDWVDNGADYSLWNLEPLVSRIKPLLSDEKLCLDYIILDYPFAYKNKEIGQFIDYAVFIDTPLDVAMARRIVRDYTGETSDKIIADLKWYLLHGRKAYLEMLTSIKPNSDLVIDGSLPIGVIVDEIVANIKKKN